MYVLKKSKTRTLLHLFQFAERVYNEATEFANDSACMKYYGISHGHCCGMFCCSMISCMTLMVLILCIVRASDVEESANDIACGVFVAAGVPIVVFGSVFFVYEKVSVCHFMLCHEASHLCKATCMLGLCVCVLVLVRTNVDFIVPVHCDIMPHFQMENPLTLWSTP